MTIELMASLMEAADAEIKEVNVESLRETTFYAVIKVKTKETEIAVDARPSPIFRRWFYVNRVQNRSVVRKYCY